MKDSEGNKIKWFTPEEQLLSIIDCSPPTTIKPHFMTKEETIQLIKDNLRVVFQPICTLTNMDAAKPYQTHIPPKVKLYFGDDLISEG